MTKTMWTEVGDLNAVVRQWKVGSAVKLLLVKQADGRIICRASEAGLPGLPIRNRILTRKCEHCGKQFVHANTVVGHNRRFCSGRCRGHTLRSRLLPEIIDRWNAGESVTDIAGSVRLSRQRVWQQLVSVQDKLNEPLKKRRRRETKERCLRKCLFCDRQFVASRPSSSQRYCNQSCAVAKAGHKPWSSFVTLKLKCATCGRDFTRLQEDQARSDYYCKGKAARVFCSKTCFYNRNVVQGEGGSKIDGSARSWRAS